MKDKIYQNQEQTNIAYAVRLRIRDQPGEPAALLESKIIEELANPSRGYHVESTSFEDEFGIMVYTKGATESIVERAAAIKETLDKYCDGINGVYSVTPMIPIESENQMTFGQTLKELRSQKKTKTGKRHTARGAASEIQMSHSYLTDLENEQQAPSGQIIPRIADHYGVDQTILMCIGKRLPEDMLNIISQHPYWMAAVLKAR